MDTCLFLYKYLLSSVHLLLEHMLYGYLLILHKCLLSSIHLLLELMLYGYLLIFTQVLIVVHTHAFSTCVSWALACWYKCFLSSMHMLLVHVFHGHLLFGTSVFCRPCTYFSYTCFMGTCFLVQVLFVACIFHCPFKGLHELIMLVFLVVRAWQALRFSTSEFFEAVMWTMMPSFTRRKRNFV